MPAAARKAAISFGMVHIPVSLYTAVQEKGVGFNQLTRDGVRVRQKKVREDTGAEVQADQIVKGYEYAKGQYVILTDDELERIKTERDRTIRILHFAPARIHSIRLLRQVLSLRAGWQRQGLRTAAPVDAG